MGKPENLQLKRNVLSFLPRGYIPGRIRVADTCKGVSIAGHRKISCEWGTERFSHLETNGGAMRRKAQRRTLAKAGLWTEKTTVTQSKAAKRQTIRLAGNASISSEHCAHRHPPSTGYAERMRNLLSIGFNCYADYLASDLWKGIRDGCLETARYRCGMCGNKAVTAHHKSYQVDVLLGRRPDLLVATCHDCHRIIERDFDGTKTSIETANRRLNLLVHASRRERQRDKKRKDKPKKKPHATKKTYPPAEFGKVKPIVSNNNNTYVLPAQAFNDTRGWHSFLRNR